MTSSANQQKSRFAFGVTKQDGHARLGTLRTMRAELSTPTFMPIGTQATVKGLLPTEIESTGARIVLVNTYHLWLRPGAENIAAQGGVNRWMSWPHATLSDSGGYQVFSLGANVSVSDECVTFRSHLDGALCQLSPEIAMQVQ